MKSIVHQYDVKSDSHVGGIDTWISDYLAFSESKVRVIGVSDSIGMILNKHEMYSIMIKKPKRIVPISVLFALRVMRHRKLLGKEIYIHRIDYAPILRLMSPCAKITLFIHTDSLMQTKSSSDSIWRFIPSFYFIYERLALFMSSQVYVYSETDFNRILKIKKSACQLRGWYNDHVFKQVGLARDDKSFMWVGRFEQPKDPLLAIRSFAKALEIDSSLNLCMIGEGSLKWAMTDEIARLGLSERITISSPLNQRELALRMNHCGTLLHTSEFEGSPRILLEALACGMRVVSNSLADPDKLSERFGSCSKSRLEGDVASALLLDLPKTRQEIELKEFLSHVAGSNIVGRDF